MPRIAIVHEWITARAGSELCFERMANIWPEADLYALAWDRRVPLEVGNRDVRTTFLDSVARSERGRAVSLPLMPAGFTMLRRGSPAYDLVLTSTHAFSRAFASKGTLQLSYTYTPMRYVWHPETDRRGAGNLLAGPRAALRAVDRSIARRVDSFAAISTVVAERIQEAYGRSAEVIFPPCDTDFFRPGVDDATDRARNDYGNEFLLSVGRLIDYKRHDLAIRVAAELGRKAIVVGSGPSLASLKELDRELGAQSVFLDGPSREIVRALMRNAALLVFPANEDFGIVPVESIACGTPVLAVDEGGARDTVHEGVGIRVPSQRFEDMVVGAEAILGNRPDPHDCRQWALEFSAEKFDDRIRSWAETRLSARGGLGE